MYGTKGSALRGVQATRRQLATSTTRSCQVNMWNPHDSLTNLYLVAIHPSTSTSNWLTDGPLLNCSSSPLGRRPCAPLPRRSYHRAVLSAEHNQPLPQPLPPAPAPKPKMHTPPPALGLRPDPLPLSMPRPSPPPPPPPPPRTMRLLS